MKDISRRTIMKPKTINCTNIWMWNNKNANIDYKRADIIVFWRDAIHSIGTFGGRRHEMRLIFGCSYLVALLQVDDKKKFLYKVGSVGNLNGIYLALLRSWF